MHTRLSLIQSVFGLIQFTLQLPYLLVIFLSLVANYLQLSNKLFVILTDELLSFSQVLPQVVDLV